MRLHSAIVWERKPDGETLHTTINAALLLSFVQCLYSGHQTGALLLDRGPGDPEMQLMYNSFNQSI